MLPTLSSIPSLPSLRRTTVFIRSLNTAGPSKKSNNKKKSETSKIEANLAPDDEVEKTKFPLPPQTIGGTMDASKLYSEFKKAKALTQKINLGAPILIPPESRDKSEDTPFWGSRGGTYRLAQTLPTLNASAILDPKGFCHNSASAATTLSGADAVKRLLRGKGDLLTVMKQELQRKRRPKSYLLTGHGIPQQLLQSHLNLADSMLRSHQNARLLSFNNSFGHLSFDLLRIRAKDGTNAHSAWPARNVDETMDMELYLTVMNRLANHLSECLQWEYPQSADPVDDDDFTPTTIRTLPRPHRWNVDILRGSVFPGMEEEPTPIVEWTPREGLLAPGHVCIRLQGAPNYTGESLRRKKKSPVTLVFDACYRNQEHYSS
jgi:hypothetical protein